VTFDLDRVEILRGPQGTLLGDNTQGGAIRFITNPPSLTSFTNLARAEWAATARGDQRYEVGAAAGGPLRTNVLGFRVSGWYRSDGGYVDRIDPSSGALVTADSIDSRPSVGKHCCSRPQTTCASQPR
jgi:outer membrane receptor protein involved in Fe transport